MQRGGGRRVNIHVCVTANRGANGVSKSTTMKRSRRRCRRQGALKAITDKEERRVNMQGG